MQNYLKIFSITFFISIVSFSYFANAQEDINMHNVEYYSICACDCLHHYEFNFNSVNNNKYVCIGLTSSGERMNSIGKTSYKEGIIALRFMRPVKQIICNN